MNNIAQDFSKPGITWLNPSKQKMALSWEHAPNNGIIMATWDNEMIYEPTKDYITLKQWQVQESYNTWLSLIPPSLMGYIMPAFNNIQTTDSKRKRSYLIRDKSMDREVIIFDCLTKQEERIFGKSRFIEYLMFNFNMKKEVAAYYADHLLIAGIALEK